MKKIKCFGNQTPYVFVIENVHGCNLACGHCAMSVLDRTPKMMTMETWQETMEIVAQVAPTCRVELAMGGEPTLDPKLCAMFREGRRISPLSQFQVTTNGTMLFKGDVTYRDLLDSGCNIVYTDMYQPRERFREMAEASGAEWWFYYPQEGEPGPEGHPSPWTYHGPGTQLIVLQENPANWPASRRNSNLLGTWLNHLNFESSSKASRFGIKEVIEPPKRRCNQPFTYAPVSWTGDYILCCQDMALETVGHGNVNEGMDGFMQFWFGQFMQEHRRWLRMKDRKSSPYCSRCSITFSRCDYLHWTDEQVEVWWDGDEWQAMPPIDGSVESTGAKLHQLGTEKLEANLFE